MSHQELDELESFQHSTDYYDKEGGNIIDNPSGMEMMFFLERVVDANHFTLGAKNTSQGCYITIEDTMGTFIVIDACSPKWGLFKHQEQFILRARVSEVERRDYEFIHQENLESFDHKLVYITEEGRHFIEARRFITMAGGTTVENFATQLNKFIDSSRLLAYALKHTANTKKIAVESGCYPANSPRH